MSEQIRPNYYRTRVRVTNVSDGDSGEKFADVECFDMIVALKLDFFSGNILKYLWRAGRKPGEALVQDMKKVMTYAARAAEEAAILARRQGG